MTKSKTTKRALILSTLSLLLCVSMLIGSTFAWFTDNASTGVNKIESGTLLIGLYTDEACTETAEGETLSFTKAGENVLWEPGCTWSLPTVYIKNEGNLAAKYIVEITGINGDAKLNEVIDWTISTGIAEGETEGHLLPDQTQAITISGHMLESAGNTYQGKTIEGISITVRATQDTVEYDSNNNTYDATAEYDDATEVTTFEELKAAIAKGGKIRLGNDTVVEEILKITAGTDVVLDMNGKKLTIKDASVDPMIDMESGSSLVITGNGTVDLEDNYYASFIFPRGDVTIENGSFLRDYDSSVPVSQYGSYFVGINGGKGVLTINGGYFDAGSYTEGDCFNNCRNGLNLSWGQKVEVYGGTFVGQNPAWGDEGMAFLCTECEHTTDYCQGTFLVGQDWHDTEMPAGYTITEGATSDGRPTYTVSYVAP